jgi:hypothetical protein
MINYKEPVDLELITENNYVFKRCQNDFRMKYKFELSLSLYKELIERIRSFDVVYMDDRIDYIQFVGIVHDNVPYRIKYNQQCRLIKSFGLVNSRQFKKYGVVISKEKYNQENHIKIFEELNEIKKRRKKDYSIS